MTHEELMAKIDKLPDVIGLADFKVRHDALRAVIELHKPFEIDRELNYNCTECEWAYPCPTIEAIEKELN